MPEQGSRSSSLSACSSASKNSYFRSRLAGVAKTRWCASGTDKWLVRAPAIVWGKPRFLSSAAVCASPSFFGRCFWLSWELKESVLFCLRAFQALDRSGSRSDSGVGLVARNLSEGLISEIKSAMTYWHEKHADTNQDTIHALKQYLSMPCFRCI